jgi:hypothetical protein
MWRTQTDPTYHKFYQCPVKALEMQQRATMSIQNSRRNQYGRNNTSVSTQLPKRSASPSRDRNVKQKSVAFQVQTMKTAEQQQEYEDELIEQHLSVNKVSAITSSNNMTHNYESEDEEFDIYNCNMMTTIPTIDADVNTRIAEARMVLQDSGANICVTPFAILEALPHLQLFEWSRPKQVIFGNGTTAISKYYVFLGPILNKTAVLSCVSTTILAVLPVNKRGYNVTFTYLQRCLVTHKDNVTPIIDEPVHPLRHLYYVDIMKFVECIEPPSHKL